MKLSSATTCHVVSILRTRTNQNCIAFLLLYCYLIPGDYVEIIKRLMPCINKEKIKGEKNWGKIERKKESDQTLTRQVAKYAGTLPQ